MARKRRFPGPRMRKIGFMVPPGYSLLASCASCQHFVELGPPHDDPEAQYSLCCNLDRSLPSDRNEAWWPWSVNHEVVANGWCPNYEPHPRGDVLEHRKEEKDDLH